MHLSQNCPFNNKAHLHLELPGIETPITESSQPEQKQHFEPAVQGGRKKEKGESDNRDPDSTPDPKRLRIFHLSWSHGKATHCKRAQGDF